MNISFSAWKMYTDCPKKFNKMYVQKAQRTVPLNEYFTLYGRAVEKFFELYSNIWRFKTPILSPEEIKRKLIFIFNDILKSSVVIWDLPYCNEPKEEIFNRALHDIKSIMTSTNKGLFLNTKAEVSISLNLKDNHKMKGRLDFVHTTPMSGEVVVFDGKGTNKIGKNVSDDQLYFYAFLYYFRFQKLPSQIGFFYYQFNTLIPVAMDMDILNDFRARLSLDVKEMFKAEHEATPSGGACKYCPYFNGCEEGEKSSLGRKRGSKIKGIECNGEIMEFGF